MKLHTAKGDRKFRISELDNRTQYPVMDDEHLLATLKVLEKRAKKGIVVQHFGGSSSDPESMYYDEEQVEGAEALEHFGYEAYHAEAVRRGLIAEHDVIIVVEGGLIQEVYTKRPTNILYVDYDNLRKEGHNKLIPIPQDMKPSDWETPIIKTDKHE